MTSTARLFSLGLALVGLGASIGAAWVHYHVLIDPQYSSFCDINATLSCTALYASRFGTFRGVPVALFGVLWFVMALLFVGDAQFGPRAARDNAPGYLFAWSTLGLAVVLYLGYASIVLLKSACILCLTVDAAVIGLFLVSGSGTSIPMTTLPRRALQDIRIWVASPVAIVVTVLMLGGVTSAIALFPREPGTGSAGAAPVDLSQDQRSEFERWFVAQPRLSLVIPAEGAKVLVVKFNDYQCPACGQSYQQYKPIFANYEAKQPGAVRLVLRDFPLNADCNDNLSRTIHAGACDAAVAVRLARLHNRGEAMEAWLYGHQETLTPPVVREAARDIGQVSDFDVKYLSTLALVKGDVALGHQLGVTSTPTFFINGVRVTGALPPQYFDQAIALELRRAETK